MAGSLIKIDEEIVTSAVASVTLTGIDSTYDVYMVRVNNVAPDGANRNLYMRVTKSGSADTTANYDYAYKGLRTDTTFSNISNTNQTFWQTSNYANSTGTSQTMNGVFYLFNFANASEYSFVTNETANLTGSNLLIGAQGGGVHTVASASDGINFYYSADNINSGVFTLYGLKK